MASKSSALSFLNITIRPTLGKLNSHSESAEVLLLGTAIMESDLQNRKQIGGGPGRGLFQMEGNTHDDIWKNYINFRSPLKMLMQTVFPNTTFTTALLETNDLYACAMARIHYLRVSSALPPAIDIRALGEFWKKYYNVKGAGTGEKFAKKYEAVMGAPVTKI